MKTKAEIESLTVEELITELNYFAHEQKERALTEEELAFQKQLRNRYIELYKQNLKENLKSIKVVDEEGNDITPQKLKDEKNR